MGELYFCFQNNKDYDQKVFYSLFSWLFRICRSPTAVRRLDSEGGEQRFLKCNLSLLAERYNVDIAQARLLQAGLFDNPVISFEQNVYNRLMESTLTSAKKVSR